jgi:hypothetical protein
MKKREIGNMALHFGLAIVLTVLVMWHRAFIILVTFIYVSLREQAQHRMILEDLGYFDSYSSPLYVVHKRTFFDFGWLGKKQAWEIGQWVIGSAVVVVLWTFIA